MTILLLESLHAEAEALLAAHGPLLRAPEPNRPPDDLAPVEAILTRGRGRIPAALLERCPRLRAVARAGAGLDNVDVAAARRRGVPVIYAPGANADTVAEHTLALILDAVRGISRCAQQVREGRWEARGSYARDEIRGLVLGVIGFGAVGGRVARLAAAFGMRVIVAARGAGAGPNATTSRDAAPPTAPSAPEAGPVLPPNLVGAPPTPASLPLEALLAEADVVTLHTPLTPETDRLLDARRLALMKPGAFLINTARGRLIDQPALAAALAAGRLGGFAADVLDAEPPSADDALLASDRVVLTPHVASLTAATYRRMCVDTAVNVLAILSGASPAPNSVFRGS